MTDQSLNTGAPRKSFLVTWLLSLLLGYFGVDRFYLGKVGTGILKLVTLGGFGIWYLIDLIIVIAGGTKDKNGQPLEGQTGKMRLIALIVTVALIIIGSATGGNAGSHNSASESSISTTDGNTEAAASDAPVAEPKWTKIATLSGSADKEGSTFTVGDGDVRMTYSFPGDDMTVYAVYVMEKGTNLKTDGGIPVVMDSNGIKGETTALHLTPGDYYLSVAAANVSGKWSVTIEELK